MNLQQYIKRNLTKIPVCVNLLLTLITSILFFSGSLGDVYALIGNHSAIYPIIGVMIAAQRESILLLGVCLVYWPLSLTVLAIGYYTAIKKGQFKTLVISTFADVLFSVWMMFLSISVGTFGSYHAFMLIGIVINLLFAVWFFYIWRKTKPEDGKNLKTA